VARSIGDYRAKMTELGGNPKTVICQPCVNTFQISDKSDFILLGCKYILININYLIYKL
jgi:hypothetical protein